MEKLARRLCPEPYKNEFQHLKILSALRVQMVFGVSSSLNLIQGEVSYCRLKLQRSDFVTGLVLPSVGNYFALQKYGFEGVTKERKGLIYVLLLMGPLTNIPYPTQVGAGVDLAQIDRRGRRLRLFSRRDVVQRRLVAQIHLRFISREWRHSGLGSPPNRYDQSVTDSLLNFLLKGEMDFFRPRRYWFRRNG